MTPRLRASQVLFVCTNRTLTVTVGSSVLHDRRRDIVLSSQKSPISSERDPTRFRWMAAMLWMLTLDNNATIRFPKQSPQIVIRLPTRDQERFIGRVRYTLIEMMNYAGFRAEEFVPDSEE